MNLYTDITMELFLLSPINYICFSKDLELKNHLRPWWEQPTTQSPVETVKKTVRLPADTQEGPLLIWYGQIWFYVNVDF